MSERAGGVKLGPSRPLLDADRVARPRRASVSELGGRGSRRARIAPKRGSAGATPSRNSVAEAAEASDEMSTNAGSSEPWRVQLRISYAPD